MSTNALLDRKDELVTQLVQGGPDYRYANERFRYRLDVLLNLHDVELALEESNANVWYMATCAQCVGAARNFEKNCERQEWVFTHIAQTGHRVIKFEEPRRQEGPA